MASPGTTPVISLINRLLELSLCKNGADTGEIFKVLGQTVEADAFAVLQFSPGTMKAKIVGASGLRTTVDNWQIPLDTLLFEDRLIAHTHATSLSDGKSFEKDPFLKEEGVRSLLFKHAAAGETCFAILAMRRKEEGFTNNEVQRFNAVAGVVDLVMIACHLRVEHGASKEIDRLTGLGLFTDFYDRMVEELSRARRGGSQVTVGVVKIEQVETGLVDDALVSLSLTFRDQLRNFDTLVRYGPSELGFLLPDLGSTEGQRVLERIFGEIVSGMEGMDKVPSIYLGYSCYPEDSSTVERLIEMAEASMNRAVEDSRPGVYRWSEIYGQ